VSTGQKTSTERPREEREKLALREIRTVPLNCCQQEPNSTGSRKWPTSPTRGPRKKRGVPGHQNCPKHTRELGVEGTPERLSKGKSLSRREGGVTQLAVHSKTPPRGELGGGYTKKPVGETTRADLEIQLHARARYSPKRSGCLSRKFWVGCSKEAKASRRVVQADVIS